MNVLLWGDVFRNKFLIITMAGMAVATASVAIVWMIMNLHHVPQYGDTVEYLALSKTLLVDQYRGIFYPLFIRISDVVALQLGVNLTVVVYLIQSLCVFCSSYALAWPLIRHLPRRTLVATATIVGVMVLTNPLVAHFSFTVLTDSLAASFSILFLASLILASVEQNKRYVYVVVGCFFLLLAAMLRVDKVYWGICVLLIFSGVLIVRYRRAAISAVVYTVGCAVVTVGCLALINAKTTVFNEARPPLDSRSILFNRVVWPRMAESYGYYSEDIRQHVSLAEAREFDSHNNHVFPFLIKHLKEKDGGQMVWSMTKSTFVHFPLQVLGRSSFDFFKYSLPNFTFPLEALHVLPESVATDWTISRMSMVRPSLSAVFLWLGTGVFVLVFSASLAFGLRSFYRSKQEAQPLILGIGRGEVVLIAGAIFANSGLFALSFGMDAHIRYALPTYTIIATIVCSLWISQVSNGKVGFGRVHI